MGEFKERVLKPASFPLAAFAFIGVLVFAVSRILLAVPEAGSTVIAFLMALAVILVGSVLSATRRIKPIQRVLLLVLGIGILGAGAASAKLGVREIEREISIPIAAKGTKFDTPKLTVPANEKVTLVFRNDDPVEHNVAIYTDDAFTPPPLFAGDTFAGVGVRAYHIEPLEPGTYAFRCDIHPVQMTGTVEAKEGFEPGEPPVGTPPPGGGPPGPAPASAEITAKALRFDTDLIELEAGEGSTILFQNLDPGTPHNVSIYTDETFTASILKETPVNGVTTVTYNVPAIDPGTYPFRCDVHVGMKGTVTVT